MFMIWNYFKTKCNLKSLGLEEESTKWGQIKKNGHLISKYCFKATF